MFLWKNITILNITSFWNNLITEYLIFQHGQNNQAILYMKNTCKKLNEKTISAFNNSIITLANFK